MALTPGTRLGAYEIIAQIGAGGMGEVYRATDCSLKRSVAIKVLPASVAGDADRLARFRREAEVLAALNHPNIAAIYGLEKTPDLTALVMELVEGEDLSAHIARGPIPLAEALPIAKQIADALEAAHEQGIIHRDLKPANIKVRTDGTVKVLDFGLAKALDVNASGAKAAAMNSPTLTSPAMTQVGMILGTAAYMSPEQARGRAVDRRADLWAFGCVLYEMLTGRRAFDGETLPDVMAEIVRAEPDWMQLPVVTSAAVRRVLRRCLTKDPKQRLRDAGDARLDLESSEPAPTGAPPGAAWPRPLAARRTWLALAVIGIACVVVAVLWWPGAPPAPIHWTASRIGGPRIAFQPRISPDGRTVAFLSLIDGQAQVGVINPDSGDWSLLTRDFSRGPVVNLAWSSDGSRIYFDRRRSRGGNIWSVPALGGEPRFVIENAFSPEPLPDGSLLFVRVTREGRAVVHRFWPDSGEIRPLAAEVHESFVTSLRAFADGREAALFGRPANATHDTPNQLYVMDVDSGKLRLIAPWLRSSDPGREQPVGVSADGTSVLIVRREGDASEVIAIARTGARDLRVLLSTPGLIAGVAEALGGHLYIDQVDRSTEHIRFGPRDVTPELLGIGLNVATGSLPLSDGRFVYPARVGGRQRLFAGRPGAERLLFAGTQDDANGPMTRLNEREFAYIGGTGDQSMITVASAEDGRLIRRLEGSRGRAFSRLAVSADRRTIYFVAGSQVWSIPAAGGDAREFAAASGITVDPLGRFVLLQREDDRGLQLVRRAADGTETDVMLPPGISLVRNSLWPTALKADGRLALVVERVDSWFWQPVVLQMGTGVATTLPFQYAGDVDSDVSWDDERITALTRRMDGALWRFEARAQVLPAAAE